MIFVLVYKSDKQMWGAYIWNGVNVSNVMETGVFGGDLLSEVYSIYIL